MRGLYETHLVVSDLQRSATFYRDVLRLTPAFQGDDICFFWIGKPREQMFGLWQLKSGEPSGERHVGRPDVTKLIHSHVAFSVLSGEMLSTVADLKGRGIRFDPFFDQSEEFVVHAWMPAVTAYFSDPDGHALEIIALLDDEPRPELGMISWSQWKNLHV